MNTQWTKNVIKADNEGKSYGICSVGTVSPSNKTIKSKLENGEEVKISGFGKWVVREKRSRPGRNPHTGQRIEISARRVVTFHPSEKLREAVNNADLDDSKLVMAGTHEEEYNE